MKVVLDLLSNIGREVAGAASFKQCFGLRVWLI